MTICLRTAANARAERLACAVLSRPIMIIRALSLIFTSLVSAPSSDCEDFSLRAHLLDQTWEPHDVEEAFAVLVTYPQNGCAPAERFVLAKRMIDEVARSPLLVRVLLLQGIREQPSGSYVSLVAQVDLLAHMVERGLVELRPNERARLHALRSRASFTEYRLLASRLLDRGAGRSIRRR